MKKDYIEISLKALTITLGILTVILIVWRLVVKG